MKPIKVRTVVIMSFLLISGFNFEKLIISSGRDYGVRKLEDSSLLITINPIVIVGNEGWFNAAANESWCTLEAGVYVIEKVSIQGSNRVSCIVIKNSDLPFKIENCRLYNAGGPVVGYSGLKLDNVSNGLIVDNAIIKNLDNGIILYNCNNIIIAENEINENEDTGILLHGSCVSIKIHSNVLDQNDEGIHLSVFCKFNTIYDNFISQNGWGIDVTGDHNHIYNNVLRNIYYGITIRSGVNNTIKENSIIGVTPSDTERGIYLENAHENEVKNNYIYCNDSGNIGIFLRMSTKNIILHNKIDLISTAILLSSSSNNNLLYNNTTDHDLYSREGIVIDRSHDNKIYYNEFVSHYYGLRMYESNCNSIWFNNISYNVKYGITSEGCNYNLISNNTINYNGIGISLDSGLNNSIMGNNISQNLGDGIILDESYNHTISFNILTGNEKGVVENDCEGNMILNNTIENRVVPLKKNMISGFHSTMFIGSFMSIVIIICYRIAWKRK